MLCRVLMHKTQEKNTTDTFFPCSVVVDSYFVGYVAWVALMSSRIYIQYFSHHSSQVTALKDISHRRFSSSGFLSILLSMYTPVQPDFRMSSPPADLFYRCKWKSQLCEKSNTNKKFLNSLELERKYKLTSHHSTEGHPFSVFCLSDHMHCIACTTFLPHAFPSPGSRFWQRGVCLCLYQELTSFQRGEQGVVLVHGLCSPHADS